MAKNIGFVSTRFAGQDGVSLESAKWAEVLWEDQACELSGTADRATATPTSAMLCPEAYFGFPENQWINEQIWKGRTA